MLCIHGLDETICPNCRIMKATVPKSLNDKKKIQHNPLGVLKNPFLEQNTKEKKEIIEKLILKTQSIDPNNVGSTLKPNLLNKIPNFKNVMFLNRIRELDLKKSDEFGILKKITPESTRIKFDEEDK